MKKYDVFLQSVLTAGGDMNADHARKLIAQHLEKETPSDPVSDVILNAYHNNMGESGELDYDSMVTDIEYAISQLRHALAEIKKHE